MNRDQHNATKIEQFDRSAYSMVKEKPGNLFRLFVKVALTICGLRGTLQTAEVILVYKQTICYIGYRMERKAYLIEGQVELLIDHVTDDGD